MEISSSANTSKLVPDKKQGYRWDLVFPGVVPAQFPGQQWVSDNVIQQIEQGLQNPQWDGVITLWGNHSSLNNLDASQLQQLVESIQQRVSSYTRIQFSAPVQEQDQWQHNITRMHLISVTMTIEEPFTSYALMEQIAKVDFYKCIDNYHSKRKDIVFGTCTLGKAWQTLGDFINHHSKGINEVAVLSKNVQVNQGITLLLAKGVDLMDKLATIWNQVNAEFEKEPELRDPEIVARAKDLGSLLQKALEFFGYSGHEDSITDIRVFVSSQPAVAQLRAVFTFKNSDKAQVNNGPETTAQILDRLLTSRPRNDIAAAVAQGGNGLAMTTRLNNRLWNIFRVDDPEAAVIQQRMQNQWGGYNFDWQQANRINQEVIEPVRARVTQVVNNLNLQNGSYTILVRKPYNDRHVFRIVQFSVNRWGQVQNNFNVNLNQYLGLVEVREVKQGDRTAIYDPMRVHSADSIRGTMMEQRVHEALAQHRVHRFTDLPEYQQHELRAQIEDYNHDRYKTRLENRRLPNSISGELKERFVGARAMRLRTHSGDLTNNPAQLMQMRVHDLFSPERLHVTQSLTQRELRFLGTHKEGGYLDTVETAIAARPQQRLHGADRTHMNRVEYDVSTGYGTKGSGNHNPMSASAPSYNRVTDALHDFD